MLKKSRSDSHASKVLEDPTNLKWFCGFPNCFGSDDSMSPRHATSVDTVLHQGPMIKKSDYRHFRWFVLSHNKLVYYEIPSQYLNINEQGSVRMKNIEPRHILPSLTESMRRGVLHLTPYLTSEEDIDDEHTTRREQKQPNHHHHIYLNSHENTSTHIAFLPLSKEIHLSGINPQGFVSQWVVQATSAEAFTEWSQAIKIAMRPQMEKVSYTNSNSPFAKCQICQTDFSFFLNRANNCLQCGMVVCSNCKGKPKKLSLLGYGSRKVSVCRTCNSPQKKLTIPRDSDLQVVVYGKYRGILRRCDNRYSGQKSTFKVQIASDKGRNYELREIQQHYVTKYSEVLIACNRIQSFVRGYITRLRFQYQVNVETINFLESEEEQNLIKSIAQRPTWTSFLSSAAPAIPPAPKPEKVDFRPVLDADKRLTFPLTQKSVLHLMELFRSGVVLNCNDLIHILEASLAQFKQSSAAMVEVSYKHMKSLNNKLTVVGDIHGQLEDLLTIFSLNGIPSDTNGYLFNGDLVDRGSHGVEVVVLILAFRLLYPEAVFIQRGNHECRLLNERFGFQREVQMKYSPPSTADSIYNLFETLFDHFSLCTLIQEEVLVMHGGLSSIPDVTLDDIRALSHIREPPITGESKEDQLVVHLLWSDPSPEPDAKEASHRGAGIEFGKNITKDFCRRNRLNYIIRSHESKEEGYELEHGGYLITIFSASYYCSLQQNKGAYIVLTTKHTEDTVIHDEYHPHRQTLYPEFHQFYSQPMQRSLVEEEKFVENTARHIHERIRQQVTDKLRAMFGM